MLTWFADKGRRDVCVYEDRFHFWRHIAEAADHPAKKLRHSLSAVGRVKHEIERSLPGRRKHSSAIKYAKGESTALDVFDACHGKLTQFKKLEERVEWAKAWEHLLTEHSLANLITPHRLMM